MFLSGKKEKKKRNNSMFRDGSRNLVQEDEIM